MSICDDVVASMAAWAAGHTGEQRDQAVDPDPEEAVVKFYTMSYKVHPTADREGRGQDLTANRARPVWAVAVSLGAAAGLALPPGRTRRRPSTACAAAHSAQLAPLTAR